MIKIWQKKKTKTKNVKTYFSSNTAARYLDKRVFYNYLNKVFKHKHNHKNNKWAITKTAGPRMKWNRKSSTHEKSVFHHPFFPLTMTTLSRDSRLLQSLKTKKIIYLCLCLVTSGVCSLTMAWKKSRFRTIFKGSCKSYIVSSPVINWSHFASSNVMFKHCSPSENPVAIFSWIAHGNHLARQAWPLCPL